MIERITTQIDLLVRRAIERVNPALVHGRAVGKDAAMIGVCREVAVIVEQLLLNER